MKQIQIGESDYKIFIENNFYYVDKTLLIKDIIEKGGKVALIPRPRRFGKTLNLSMLRYFFEKSDVSNAYLFHDTLIWQENEKYRAMQGQYPIIFISFKGAKQTTWQKIYQHITILLSQLFDRHYALLHTTMTDQQRLSYQAIIQKTATEVELSNSLKFLTEVLYSHYKQKVIVLIDEYDTPIHEAYAHGFYDEAIIFLKSFLADLLKDNDYLERGVLTGILMVAKAGIFSDLNNISIFHVTNPYLADKFGFTDDEVKKLLQDFHLETEYKNIREWYDGYHFGEVTHMYNPWSILNCIQYKGTLKTYWANTSQNLLIKQLIAKASSETKEELSHVLQNQPVSKKILDSITLPELEKKPEIIWSLLLYAGYLTYEKLEAVEGKFQASLTIPNLEIKNLYKDLITDIFIESVPGQKIQQYLHAL